ncbi:MAG: DUF3592 domain-containing protein [Planctomycetota bacterium]|nr:DUF3592 domain-containing protein [Planctomycetota bacterium]MDA0933184.1 DUF3592 domain-containing protein [Planctomycetota bacterium]
MHSLLGGQPDVAPLLGPIDRSFLWIGRGLLAATVFVVLLFTVPTLREVAATDGYVEAPGKIIHSAIETRIVQGDGRSRSERVASVRYLYTPVTEGVPRSLLGDRVEVMHVRTDSSEGRIVKRYPKGAEVVVWHDPEEPWRVVLERGGSTWFAFFPPAVTLFLGALFAGLSARALRRAGPRGGAQPALDDDQRQSLGGCLRIVAILFLGFALLMALMVVVFGTDPVAAEIDASGFEPCPAVVEESTFVEVEDRPGEALPRVVFRYRAAGRTRTSGLITLLPITSSGAAGWSETVWRSEPGSEVTVYVDPEDAGRAVLVRDSVSGALGTVLLFLLVPAAVFAFGLALLAQARRLRVVG